MTNEKVQLADIELNFWRAGSGPPILLVHGFPLDHTMWQFQLEMLAGTFDVIAPDLRGFGANQPATELTMGLLADDLANLLDALQIAQPVIFCGLSMGGYIGWEFWQRYPQRLSSLVMCDTRAAADSPEVARGREMAADRALEEGVGFLADSLFAKLFADDSRRNQSQLLEQTHEVMLRTTPESVAAALRGMATRGDFSATLKQIELPALLVCGQHDAISPPAEMQHIAGSMPRASFVEVSGAGHMAPLESPRAVNDAIIAWHDSIHPD